MDPPGWSTNSINPAETFLAGEYLAYAKQGTFVR